jgi:hypothetical protein
LVAKSGSRGNSQDRYCQGLIASVASHRRTVDAETASTMPRATASWANCADGRYIYVTEMNFTALGQISSRWVKDVAGMSYILAPSL